MIHTGVRELKNNLSRFLVQVKEGKEIVITERGKPIARIVKESPDTDRVRARLAPLIESGLVVWPDRTLAKNDLAPLPATGRAAAEMVVEDRR